ncbi:hypothetical protein ACV1DN_13425 [Aeromonas allosaccharophila]
MSIRPEFETFGSTVSASEAIVQYLIPWVQADAVGGNRQIDRVTTVERHIGSFDKPEDIKRWMSRKNGGVRVAAMRIISMTNQGTQLVGTVEFAAFVFCSDEFAYAKDARAEVVASRVCKALMSKGGWTGTGAAKAPSMVRADNLYSVKIDELGVAIWSVTWQQDWPLDNPIDPDTLDDFLRFNWLAKQADGAPELEADIILPGPNP